jgi:hypothetical protein
MSIIINKNKSDIQGLDPYHVSVSDKRFAAIIWVEMALLFLVANIDIWKKYTKFFLLLFFITVIIGFARKRFLSFYDANKSSKISYYSICIGIILFMASFIILISLIIF